MESWTQPPPPHHARPRRNVILIIALPVLLLVAVVTGYLATSGSALGGDGREQDKIGKTVTDFAEAVDRNDNATVLSMLCAQEAEGVADDIDSPDHHGNPQAKLIPITIEEIRISGDVAQVQVTRPRQQPASLFLRKEAGVWKLCDPERYDH